jgi:hypothetical protein
MMNPSRQRAIVRWIHIIFSIPIGGYVYSSFKEIPNYAPAARYVFFPGLVLTGLWLWKGHLLRRLLFGTSPSRSPRELAASAQSAVSNN